MLTNYARATEREAQPLGNTIAKDSQGFAGFADFAAGRYPACSRHGAMNRVSPEQLWRCLTCNIGMEILPKKRIDTGDYTF